MKGREKKVNKKRKKLLRIKSLKIQQYKKSIKKMFNNI